LRADLDALPIHEASGEEFASEHDGVMHACGHDGHTAMVLATARVLAERRSELAGEIRFVFQHAEELPPGGGSELGPPALSMVFTRSSDATCCRHWSSKPVAGAWRPPP